MSDLRLELQEVPLVLRVVDGDLGALADRFTSAEVDDLAARREAGGETG